MTVYDATLQIGDGGRMDKPTRNPDDAHDRLMGWCIFWFTMTVILALLLIAGLVSLADINVTIGRK